MTKKLGPRVFVGMSGGVDSSVAALRLKKRGFDVVGVFIKVWHPDFLVCNWEAERLDAMRVAAHLDIPFLTCDAEQAYKQGVADYFIGEYKAGRTPNPDVMCNKQVKFGAFIDFAKANGADYIATGHYARRVEGEGEGEAELHRGIDPDKDQSYFLWALNQDQLDFTLLPIGDTIKETVRTEARLAGLPTAQKKDSQGICFLGHVDIKDFLSHYIKLIPGSVQNEQGEVIGTHSGALIYTIGQRHGLQIDTKNDARTPYYVIDKDIKKNLVIASIQKPSLEPATSLTITEFVLRTSCSSGESVEVQTRYRQTPFMAKITSMTDTTLTLETQGSTDAVAKGQSCVLYRGTSCLGGGIIV
jgi:tRNA-specific 2-thiouridylase